LHLHPVCFSSKTPFIYFEERERVMRIQFKLLLLLVIVMMLMSSAYAQTSVTIASRDKSVYSDPKVWEAIDFLKNRLPQLVKDNKVQAVDEYADYLEDLNKLGEADVLFILGQFYAEIGEMDKAVPLFQQLVNNPELGENARKMLQVLLYYRAVGLLGSNDKQAARDYLEIVLNNFPLGKYYPTFLYLWADMVSESGKVDEVNAYLQDYAHARDWMHNEFKPRKLMINRQIRDLDFTEYYKRPGEDAYLVEEAKINWIQSSLRALYDEFKQNQGILSSEAIERITKEEIGLLDELKKQLKSYVSPPPLDLKQLASQEYGSTEMAAYAKYREGAVLLEQLKGTSEYYGKVIDIIDKIFDKQYQLFVQEDPTISGKGYSDMEMKRLFDIERNIELYTEIIAVIDEIIANKDYTSLNMDLVPERQDYADKLADLQNRKERYLAFRKHSSDIEEAVFNDLLEEYYSLNREKATLDELLPEVEDVMVSLIMKNFPKDQEKIIQGQLTLMENVSENNLSMDSSVNPFIANLDFINLQLKYRQLRYQDTLRQANNGSAEEIKRAYEDILASKDSLLTAYKEFVAANPYFQALEQPSGGYLLNNAIMYYNMAELQYAIDLDHPELSLPYYRKVLAIDPLFASRDHVLYNVAFLSSEEKVSDLYEKIEQFRTANPNKDRPSTDRYTESDFREALDNYTEIVDSGKYNSSPLYEESVYRLGRLYFLLASDAENPSGYYAKAIQRFDYLINKPGSNYQYAALYQRGWVSMNQGTDASLKAALNDFASLIKAVDESRIADPHTALDYKNDSIENIAYTLIAMDDIEFTAPSVGVGEFNRVLGDYQDLKVKNTILAKAADKKIDMLAPRQAIDFMEPALLNTPMALNNPALVDSIIKLYYTPQIPLREGDVLPDIRAQKTQFIKDNYSNHSAWYDKNVKGADLNQPELVKQLQVIRDAYEYIRSRNFEKLFSSATDADLNAYNKHLSDFASYKELFKDDYGKWISEQDRNNTQLVAQLAEKRNTPLDYSKAASSLTQYDDVNPTNQDFMNNEGLAYRYAVKVYEYYQDPGFNPGAGLPADKQAAYLYFQKASLRYYKVLLDTGDTVKIQNAVQVMMNLADIDMLNNMPDMAKDHYFKLMNDIPQLDNLTYRNVYLNLAKIDQQAQKYTSAREFYQKALPYAKDAQDRDGIAHLARLQLQSDYQLAEQNGDYDLEAQQLLALANEYKDDKTTYEQYRYQASKAYIKANKPQNAIDLKLELANVQNKMTDKYRLYYECWSIADSIMNDKVQADNLKKNFIEMYPASNLAFNLRVAAIEDLAKQPASRGTASEHYLALHNEVRASKIDSGEVTPEDIYLWALELYREDNNLDKLVELLPYFVETYPNNNQNVDFLTLLADEYLQRGDEVKFEYYARELFKLDNTKYERYQTTAQRKLGRIAQSFDQAYVQKDWAQVFQKRDEFKKLEAEYLKEGLKLDNAQVYTTFNIAQKEYDDLQIKLAFLQNFDKQIKAIENGYFLKSTPNDLVLVSKTTTWKNHLFGGKVNRVANLRETTQFECNKVTKLIASDTSGYLDIPRRLKALNLICKINDFAAENLTKQINKYLDISYEMAPYKDRKKVSEKEYNDLVNNQLLPYAQDFINQYYNASTDIYTDIYRTYNLAGYSDQYTRTAEQVLTDREKLPEMKTMATPVGKDWKVTLQLPEGGNQVINSVWGTTTSPRGQLLSTYTIPGKHSLLLEHQFDLQVIPEFAFIHVVFPYNQEIYVNGEKLDLVYIPIDTLAVGKPETTHYAAKIDGKYWKQGINDFKGLFQDLNTAAVSFAFNSVLLYNISKYSETFPRIEGKLVSDTSWKVYSVDPQTDEQMQSYAVPAEGFDLPIDRGVYLVDESVQPIWASKLAYSPDATISFVTEFFMETAFQNGYIDFVAPDNSTLYINDQILVEGSILSFDTDPFTVYPSHLEIPQGMVVSGKNTLRIDVSGNPLYPGLMVEMDYTQAAKE
jgi:hypothetical protein